VRHVKFLIIKPTRCFNISNLFLEWNYTCFGQFLCPSSGVFHCTHSNGICLTGLLTACEQELMLCVQWKTPDYGQWNCPKHVEFHSKNKFKKLMHIVGFIIRNISRTFMLSMRGKLQNFYEGCCVKWNVLFEWKPHNNYPGSNSHNLTFSDVVAVCEQATKFPYQACYGILRARLRPCRDSCLCNVALGCRAVNDI